MFKINPLITTTRTWRRNQHECWRTSTAALTDPSTVLLLIPSILSLLSAAGTQRRAGGASGHHTLFLSGGPRRTGNSDPASGECSPGPTALRYQGPPAGDHSGLPTCPSIHRHVPPLTLGIPRRFRHVSNRRTATAHSESATALKVPSYPRDCHCMACFDIRAAAAAAPAAFLSRIEIPAPTTAPMMMIPSVASDVSAVHVVEARTPPAANHDLAATETSGGARHLTGSPTRAPPPRHAAHGSTVSARLTRLRPQQPQLAPRYGESKAEMIGVYMHMCRT